MEKNDNSAEYEEKTGYIRDIYQIFSEKFAKDTVFSVQIGYNIGKLRNHYEAYSHTRKEEPRW